MFPKNIKTDIMILQKLEYINNIEMANRHAQLVLVLLILILKKFLSLPSII